MSIIEQRIHDKNNKENNYVNIRISYMFIIIMLALIACIIWFIRTNPHYEYKYYAYIHSYSHIDSYDGFKNEPLDGSVNNKGVLYDLQNIHDSINHTNEKAVGCIFMIHNYGYDNICSYGLKKTKLGYVDAQNKNKYVSKNEIKHIPLVLERLIEYDDSKYEYYMTGETHVYRPCYNHYC